MSFLKPLKGADQETGGDFRPRFDDKGLITAVAQNEAGKVLMVAHMNEAALLRTLESGKAWYFSRSRNQLWLKGETSGQVQSVLSIKTDCDQDCLLLTVRVGGDGGACHTGEETCFFREVTGKETLKRF